MLCHVAQHAIVVQRLHFAASLLNLQHLFSAKYKLVFSLHFSAKYLKFVTFAVVRMRADCPVLDETWLLCLNLLGVRELADFGCLVTLKLSAGSAVRHSASAAALMWQVCSILKSHFQE